LVILPKASWRCSNRREVQRSAASRYMACLPVLKGKRLLGSAGCFRGVEVPDELNDELLDDLPYVDLFYRFLRGWAIAFPCN
jgi:hypothetical protein